MLNDFVQSVGLPQTELRPKLTKIWISCVCWCAMKEWKKSHQVMSGKGFPSTRHSKQTLSPSIASTFFNSWTKTGGCIRSKQHSTHNCIFTFVEKKTGQKLSSNKPSRNFDLYGLICRLFVLESSCRRQNAIITCDILKHVGSFENRADNDIWRSCDPSVFLHAAGHFQT